MVVCSLACRGRPRSRTLLLPTKMEGRVAMRLIHNFANVPEGARGGLIQVVGATVEGRVLGGLDVALRP